MAFSNTFDSLSNAIIPQDIPVELIIDNHGVIINPNLGSYFYLDDIDDNITITLESLDTGCKTLYLKLSFEDDNIVINWPSNIKWYENTPPMISQFEDLFISLITLDNGITWYSVPVIKTKPLVDLSYYMGNTYPSEYLTMTSVPVSDLNYFSSIRPISCEGMFNSCNNLASIDLSGLDTEYAINLGSMFYGCESLSAINLANFDTSSATSIQRIFYDCSNLESINVSTWDTSNILNMEEAFYNCSSLTSLDLSLWDTSQVTNMANMFSYCSSLSVLDLSNLTSNGDCRFMFTRVSLNYLILDSTTVKFTITPNQTCKILVPASALETYKSHSAWSSRASQFDAIENYTIVKSNGTVTVTPNE